MLQHQRSGIPSKCSSLDPLLSGICPAIVANMRWWHAVKPCHDRPIGALISDSSILDRKSFDPTCCSGRCTWTTILYNSHGFASTTQHHGAESRQASGPRHFSCKSKAMTKSCHQPDRAMTTDFRSDLEALCSDDGHRFDRRNATWSLLGRLSSEGGEGLVIAIIRLLDDLPDGEPCQVT